MKFDENGFAMEAGEVTVYSYHDFTHEYVGKFVEIIPVGFSIPGHSTLISPPNLVDGFARCFNGEWEQVEDNRGKKVYSTTNRAEYIMLDLGPIPDGFTILAPGPHDVWDKNKWVEDSVQADASTTASNTQLKEYLMYKASQQIAILTDATDPDVMGDDVDPIDVTNLKLWKAYRVKLSKVTDMLNPVWPDMPNT